MMAKKKKKMIEKNRCQLCGSYSRVISKYGLNICGKCFREVAESMGFTKYQ